MYWERESLEVNDLRGIAVQRLVSKREIDIVFLISGWHARGSGPALAFSCHGRCVSSVGLSLAHSVGKRSLTVTCGFWPGFIKRCRVLNTS